MAADERRQPMPLVADLVRDHVEQEQCDRILAQLEERRDEPVRAERPWLVPVATAATLLMLVGAALLIWRGWIEGDTAPPEPGPLLLATGGTLEQLAAPETAAEPESFELSDGSEVELTPGTAVTTTKNTGRRVALKLGAGRATFKVARGGPRRWSVDAGIATVEVVGTVFTVDRSEERVEVAVERGRVRVRSETLEGGSRELAGGESLLLRQSSDDTPAEEPPEPEPEPDAEPPDAAGPATWQQLARRRSFDRAYDLLGPDGIRREMERAGSLQQLVALADVARRSGHPLDAVAPLERAVERFPSHPQASVTAFTLGRLESDVLRRHGRAARAFQRCLRLNPPGALRESAYARLAEAQGRSGNFDAARSAAREYLRRYPDGRRAEELRRWVEPR